MRKYPGGAVSALGATQASYTLPNHGQCSTVVRAMTDTWTVKVPGLRDYAGPVFSVSGQMSYMDAYLAKYWPEYPYYFNIWMYLTLGDPAMPVWAGTPGTPTVSYPDTIPLGPYNFNVEVTVGGIGKRQSRPGTRTREFSPEAHNGLERRVDQPFT